MRSPRKGLVLTLACPSVEPIFLGSFDTTAMTSFKSHASRGSRCLPYDWSLVEVTLVAASHSTKPAGIERAALPDPCRARIERLRSDNSRPAARVPASDNAAYADALDARPVALGKLLRECTRALVLI